MCESRCGDCGCETGVGVWLVGVCVMHIRRAGGAHLGNVEDCRWLGTGSVGDGRMSRNQSFSAFVPESGPIAELIQPGPGAETFTETRCYAVRCDTPGNPLGDALDRVAKPCISHTASSPSRACGPRRLLANLKNNT